MGVDIALDFSRAGKRNNDASFSGRIINR